MLKKGRSNLIYNFFMWYFKRYPLLVISPLDNGKVKSQNERTTA